MYLAVFTLASHSHTPAQHVHAVVVQDEIQRLGPSVDALSKDGVMEAIFDQVCPTPVRIVSASHLAASIVQNCCSTPGIICT